MGNPRPRGGMGRARLGHLDKLCCYIELRIQGEIIRRFNDTDERWFLELRHACRGGLSDLTSSRTSVPCSSAAMLDRQVRFVLPYLLVMTAISTTTEMAITPTVIHARMPAARGRLQFAAGPGLPSMFRRR